MSPLILPTRFLILSTTLKHTAYSLRSFSIYLSKNTQLSLLGENCTHLPGLKEADRRWSGYHQSLFGCCGHFVGDVDNVNITLISALRWHGWYSPLLQWRQLLVSPMFHKVHSQRVSVGVGSCWVIVQYEHVRFLTSLLLLRSYVLIMGPAFDGTLVFEQCISIFNHSAKKPF